MTRIYVLFSVVGWAWAVIVAIFLAIKLSQKQPRGFEVVPTDEKQH